MVCLVVRAVYIDVAVDYSTDAFLQVFRRFVSVRGYPRKVFSDNGTQLVGASKELKDIASNLDQDKISAFGIENGGVEWTFSPGDAPWYNGATEASPVCGLYCHFVPAGSCGNSASRPSETSSCKLLAGFSLVALN